MSEGWTSTLNGPLSSFTYDPFGNILPGSAHPGNTLGSSYGYAGPNQKITETSQALTPIQMGARVYLPTLGRFASVDPIQGGTLNSYVYVVDPINGNDYSGLLGVVMSSSNVTLTVTYNYGMQSGWGGSTLQSSATNTRLQATKPAARTQGPGSARGNTGRTAPPVKAKPKGKSVASKMGGGIVSGTKWAGRTAWGGIEKLADNPQAVGVSEGCLVGTAGGLAAGGVVWLLGGPGVTLVALAGSCALGAAGGFYDSLEEGSGQPFRDLDNLQQIYDIYRYFQYK